jgi:glycosyltransferase involved in cell wall biosynthesis
VNIQSILYISYDGMLEPLGQSQVLAYLKRLAVGRHIQLISFEKLEDWANVNERTKLADDIAAAGIVWHPLRYHKWPSSIATLWDIVNGIALGIWLVLRYKIRIVHARSYVSSVIAIVLKRLTGIKYIFDMRGFWADEKVDGGSWAREGLLYQTAKIFEKIFFLEADHVVSLTHAAVREIKLFPYMQGNMPPISVIPTCADLSLFKPLPRTSIVKLNNEFVLGYVGSVGTYYLFDEVIACFIQLLNVRPDAKLLIINRGQHGFILNRLANAGIADNHVQLISAKHDEIPIYMSMMDAGIFFIKPVFSKQASAPTKLAEFLGCGIPCLGNAGVGDLAEVLENEKVGIAIKSFDAESMAIAMQSLLQLTADSATSLRCVNAAKKYFSLDDGVLNYNSIYNKYHC